jgi:predicted ATPase
VIEDTHWIDPTTLELIELALDRIQTARVFVLITARPTFLASFGSHPVVTRLALNRLGREATQSIIARITDGKRLPETLLNEIISKTDGVPLFVEEMTKAVIESVCCARASTPITSTSRSARSRFQLRCMTR